MKKWSIDTIPDYPSDRVTIGYAYDSSNGRHQTHYKHLQIDGIVVFSKSWHEDDDFSNGSDDEPETLTMWQSWLKSLNLKT